VNVTKYAWKKYKISCHQMCYSKLQDSKTRFRPGLCPGSRWGSLRRYVTQTIRPPSRLGKGHPFPWTLDTPPHSLPALPSLASRISISSRRFGATNKKFWIRLFC